MKKKINIKNGLSMLLLVLGILASPLYGQELFKEGERQPFNSSSSNTAQSGQPLKAPGSGLGDPGVPPPPTEEDKVGGATVEDAYWAIMLLAVGYGAFRKRKLTPKSPKGDFGGIKRP